MLCVMKTTIAEVILNWFRPEARPMPWRNPDIFAPLPSAYSTWIAETMLQQTQVATVADYWTRWLAKWPTVDDLAHATDEEVACAWAGLGYYTRARNVLKAACVIVRDFNGIFPKEYEDLLKLPGVGPYTAGAIASIAYNRPVPVVDTNVLRVLCRHFAISLDEASETVGREMVREHCQQLLWDAEKTGHPKACSWFNQALMDLGATICLPTAPTCEKCPLAESCQARGENNIEKYPKVRKKEIRIERGDIAIFVYLSGKGILMEQRPETGHNPRFWQLPMLEGVGLDEAKERFAGQGLVLEGDPLAQVRHSITCHNIRVRVYGGKLMAKQKAEELHFYTKEQLANIPISSSHRKVLKLLVAGKMF